VGNEVTSEHGRELVGQSLPSPRWFIIADVETIYRSAAWQYWSGSTEDIAATFDAARRLCDRAIPLETASQTGGSIVIQLPGGQHESESSDEFLRATKSVDVQEIERLSFTVWATGVEGDRIAVSLGAETRLPSESPGITLQVQGADHDSVVATHAALVDLLSRNETPRKFWIVNRPGADIYAPREQGRAAKNRTRVTDWGGRIVWIAVGVVVAKIIGAL
jgi:hypothetical protein